MSSILDNVLLELGEQLKQKWMVGFPSWVLLGRRLGQTDISVMIAFSGGQDSINLIILWKSLISSTHFPVLKKKPSMIWCHHIWKITDFYLFRHSFQISFLLNQPFFYTIFFSKYFSEKKARKFRYFSFLRIARYSGYDSVLTAHTQNDSMETFFINLFRGSGPFGLQTLRNFQVFLNDECSQTFY